MDDMGSMGGDMGGAADGGSFGGKIVGNSEFAIEDTLDEPVYETIVSRLSTAAATVIEAAAEMPWLMHQRVTAIPSPYILCLHLLTALYLILCVKC